jgi:hypothetical protein
LPQPTTHILRRRLGSHAADTARVSMDLLLSDTCIHKHHQLHS